MSGVSCFHPEKSVRTILDGVLTAPGTVMLVNNSGKPPTEAASHLGFFQKFHIPLKMVAQVVVRSAARENPWGFR